jgi:hypothetical protein
VAAAEEALASFFSHEVCLILEIISSTSADDAAPGAKSTWTTLTPEIAKSINYL